MLAAVKARISAAQLRAATSVNRELIALYFEIGAKIRDSQLRSGWGSAVVEKLSADLRRAFPKLEGFSPRNLWRMRAFFAAWSDAPSKVTQLAAETPRRGGRGHSRNGPPPELPQPVAETSRPSIPDLALALPWGHHAVLLERLEAQAARRWYAERIRAEGWSRARLEAEIEKDAYARQGRAQNNFARALPDAQSALAQEALKDPYNFDFLTLGPKAPERVAERGLLAHVREFLLELGAGFAFVGSQVKLTVEGRDSYLDLLFFHVKLRCYVVVELKARRFKPEFVGKLNYYLSAVDDLLRGPEDRPTIGLLLCKSRRKVEVEYALRGVAKPIGIADWRDKIADRFPAAFAGSLPTVEEIEAELSSRPKRAARRGKP